MANLVISIWVDYGLCIKNLWHVLYGIKLWITNAKEGFDGGLVLKLNHYGFDYGYVGKNLVDSGNKGGIFMPPWKE